MLPAPKKRAQTGTGGAAPATGGSELKLGMERKERVLGGGAARREDEALVVAPMGESMADGDGEKEEEYGVSLPLAEEEPVKQETKLESPPPPASTSSTSAPKPATQFLPQSVARKPIVPASAFRKKKTTATTATTSSTSTISTTSKPAEKISLFSAVPAPSPSAPSPSVSASASASASTKSVDYTPLLVTSAPEPPPEAPPSVDADTVDPNAYGYGNGYYNNAGSKPTSQPEPDPNDLEAIARNAGLDDNELRQLLGRHRNRSSAASSSAAPVIKTFSVAAEYDSNAAAIRAGTLQAYQVNPVRSIAPGKHQLSQLLNAAQAQRGALEDKWAEGKRKRGGLGKGT
ncbi:mitotic checkpoint regulator, MAD2B-interacting-domain-containing protein, partial [Kalaharituber pfeilii]